LNSTDKRSLPYGRDDEGGRDDGKGQYDGNGRDDGKGQYEGKARQDAVTLKPGQQSVITGNNRIAVKQIDVEEAVAWKNGFFLFKATKLETVMQQVERWYNVEVVYQEPELKNITLSGSVSRYDNVSRILKTIENTDAVKIKLEGKKIIVMK
jgi:ferric-dicitrate binding protein FerR (iron transport regulator)